MTLAERLSNIALAPEDVKADLTEQFLFCVSGHPEEDTLLDCLCQAELERLELYWDRNIFVPEGLQEEGFWIRPEGSSYYLSFAQKPAT